MPMSDTWIRKASDPDLPKEKRLIDPFVEKQMGLGVISYGLSSYGYDARLADTFRIFSPANAPSAVIDPKNFDPGCLVEKHTDAVVIPPNSYALGRTVEWLHIPRDVLCLCIGKSTYARCGIIINVTPLEPEWKGFVTLEISNSAPLPARVYANEGICQFVFFHCDEVCETSYNDRVGKYQEQRDITLARVG